jgi:hypothetical protein
VIDKLTNRVYFNSEISIDKKTIPDDIATKITAGMNTDVIIQTGERTVLSYLFEPLFHRLWTSMRER